MQEKREICMGGFYRHFKDKLYQVREIAYHSETKEKMVVYQALYGDFKIYVRPYEMFMSEVDHEKYPEIKQLYRFEQIRLPIENAQVEKKEEIQKEQSEHISKNINENEPMDEEGIDPRLLMFLEASDYREKLNVLTSLKSKIDDRLINDIAISLDITVEEGPLEKRYESLRSCLLTQVKFECNRLR